MKSPINQLQKAIIAALKSDTELFEMIAGRVYDNVPETSIFPYISIGASDVNSENAGCLIIDNIAIQIDCWSRDVGFKMSREIADRARVIIDGSEDVLNVAGLVLLQHNNTRSFRDPDGLTSHSAILFEAAFQRDVKSITPNPPGEGGVPETRRIIAGEGLSGGGTLANDVTIRLSQASIAAIALAITAVQPEDIGTAAKENKEAFATSEQGQKADEAFPASQAGELAKKDKVTVTDISANGAAGAATYLRGDGTWSVPPSGGGGTGNGDMLATVYDPKGKKADVFDMDNMFSGETNKVFTGDEKAKLEGLPEDAVSTSVNISVGKGLVGGGDLSSDRSISLSSDTMASLEKADRAVQEGDLGTASKADIGDFATAAQGILADNALPSSEAKALARKDKIEISDIAATGTASATTVLYGDGEWKIPPSGSGGTPSGDFVPINRIIGAGDGLSGGGDLSENRSFSLSQETKDALSSAKTALQPSDIGTAAKESKEAFATAEQGTKADTAIQPGDIKSAAYSEKTEFATAEQGIKADEAFPSSDAKALAKMDKISVEYIDASGDASETTVLYGNGEWKAPPSGGGEAVPASPIIYLNNWIINGCFNVVQRNPFRPSTKLYEFGYDRWMNIPEGFQQFIENVPDGKYALFWDGGGNGEIANIKGASPIEAVVKSGNIKVIVPSSASRVCMIMLRGEIPSDNPCDPRPFADELLLCKRYYQKSHPYSYIPSGSGINPYIIPFQQGGLAYRNSIRFEIEMCKEPKVSLFSTSGTADGVVTIVQAGSAVKSAAKAENITPKQFSILPTATPTEGKPITEIVFHYSAEAELP